MYSKKRPRRDPREQKCVRPDRVRRGKGRLGREGEAGENNVKKSKWEKHQGRKSGWGHCSVCGLFRSLEFTDKSL